MKLYNGLCTQCNKDFWTKDKRRKFCSPSCASIYNNLHRGRFRFQILNCSYCKKEIYKRNCEIRTSIKKRFKHFYCSKTCAGYAARNKKRLQTSNSLINYYKIPRNKPKYRKGGYRKDLKKYFRSSWEANFARILNYKKLSWEYEEFVFTIYTNNKTHTYRPDFFIPKYNVFYEIKGYWRNELDKEKFKLFSKEYRVKLIDENEYKKLAKKYQNIINWEGRKYAK